MKTRNSTPAISSHRAVAGGAQLDRIIGARTSARSKPRTQSLQFEHQVSPHPSAIATRKCAKGPPLLSMRRGRRLLYGFVMFLAAFAGCTELSFGQCCPPVITNQPQSQSVIIGSTTSFSVGVSSDTIPTYQWKYNGANISGATATIYTIPNTQPGNAGNYSVAVTNQAGWTLSSNASLAVLSATSVVAWGNNSYNQTNVPPGLNNVVTISAGYVHSLALRSDHTVSAWGYNADGRASIPNGLSNVVAIAAGAAHNVALLANSTVVSWGTNYYGPTTNVPPGLSNVVAIASGDYYSLALKQDGMVVGWGLDEKGQTNVPAGLSNVVAIACGATVSLALKSDGTVIGWGDNDEGQASPPAGLSNVVGIAAGVLHGLALKSDGSVVGWGTNSNEQLTIPPGLSNVVAIAAGDYHSLALRQDGIVIAWGQNSDGQTSVPPTLNGVIAIAGGRYHSLALRRAGVGPVITTPPHNTFAYAGGSVSLGVFAAGTAPLGYQWLLNGTNLADSGHVFGSHSNILKINPVQIADAGNYSVVVNNGYGSATGSVVVTVQSGAPTIVQQPQGQTRYIGDTVAFAITALGSQPLSYQWYFNGGPVPGATTSSYTLTGVQPGEVGTYSCLVSNSPGQTNSAGAPLNVLGTAPEATFCADFNNDPSGSVSFFGSAQWVPPGGANSTGFVSLTENVNFQSGAAVFKEIQPGGSLVSFRASMNVQIGGGSWTPADGFSFSFARTNDPVLLDGQSFVFAPDESAPAPEEGTLTGLSIGFDTYNNGYGDVVGISVRVDGQLLGQYSLPTFNGAANDGSSLQTGPLSDDSSDPAKFLSWAPLQVSLYADGTLDISYKGTFVTPPGGLQTLWSPGAGQFILGARTGDLNEIHRFDNVCLAVNFSVPPGIVSPPNSLSVLPGRTVPFSVKASGAEPLSYQWEFNGTAIPGATGTNYTVTNAQDSDMGTYTVVVTNAVGMTNADATLTVFRPAVQLLSSMWATNGFRFFTDLNAPGSSNLVVVLDIKATTNFVDWLLLDSFAFSFSGETMISYTDQNAAMFPRRFYRANLR